MFWGFLILLMGVLMLLDRLGIIYGNFWEYFWPGALVALGASMIFKHRKSQL
jgi:hypothetical protein